MPNNPKFPSSVEIKRVIAAATRAGIEVGSIEIHRAKIIIHRKEGNAPSINDYDIWKMSEGDNKAQRKLSAEKTDAPVRKPRG